MIIWAILEALLATIGGLGVLAWLGCFVSAAVLSRAEDGTGAAMDQAIAVTKPPAPRLPPSAAPGPSHSPVNKRISVHTCGCTWVWDRRTRRWEPAYDCGRIDEQLRNLTQ